MRGVFYGVISQGVAPHFFDMEEKICSFFGHRSIDLTDELYATTKAEILRSVTLGCRIFYFGGYGDFSTLCHKIVTEIKNRSALLEIKRVYCVSQERDLRKKAQFLNREEYEDVIYLVPSFEGWYKSIYFRNCAMIDQSDVVIFYAEKRKDSGAYKAYKYAKGKKGKRIVNLF